MPAKDFILAIDEGTTGCTALVVDRNGRVISRGYRELRQIYPAPGWVEHDPQEIFQNCLAAAREAVAKSNVSFSDIQGLGITNQRETVVVWERATGKPIANAIVWQCRRTAAFCEGLKQKGLGPAVRRQTGLPIDAYFSATKIRWLLDNTPDGQRRAQSGELLCGTVDAWLVWNLTGGKMHVTDYSNASRTMLFNIRTLRWDKELLAMLDIPAIMLPAVLPSSQIIGETTKEIFDDAHIPIAGIAGDQQAALFGQACFQKGTAKNTYGTGSFVLANTGNEPIFSPESLITALAWGLGGEVTYALEGSIFITGAAVQWLRDGLGLIKNVEDIEPLAAAVLDNGGVYFVPAFTGLGAPYWDMYARGTMVGLTRGVNKGHIARAVLEAIAFQTRDVIDAMRAGAKPDIPVLRVDGGGSANNLLMQFQADILGIPLQRAQSQETTALGAAFLAGLAVGTWKNVEEVGKTWQSSASYEPRMSEDRRETLYHHWRRAVERSRRWDLP